MDAVTLKFHDEYPEDGRLELPAVDFHHSRKVDGYWSPRLIHSPMGGEQFPERGDRREALTAMILPTLLNRLLNEPTDVDYTLNVYIV